MTAIDYLKDRGFELQLANSRVWVSPSSRITESDRQYIMLHRLELIEELAAGDGVERRMSWKVARNGKPIATIAGMPITKQEALLSAQFRWPDADVIE